MWQQEVTFDENLTRKKGPASRHQQLEGEKKTSRFPDVRQSLTMIRSILKSAAALTSSLHFSYKSLKSNRKYTRHCKEWGNKADAQEGIVIPSP